MTVWAGVIPLQTRLGMPVLDAHSNPDTALQQDFSRIAEILRPSKDANEPGTPAPSYGEPRQGDRLAVAPTAPATQVPASTSGAAGPAEAAKVGIIFTLADGSTQGVSAKVGATLMEAATEAGVPGIVAECGGSMACATCHVYVDPAWIGLVPPPAAGEAGMLDFVEGGRRDGSRLSCQITVTDALEGFQATVPAGQR